MWREHRQSGSTTPLVEAVEGNRDESKEKSRETEDEREIESRCEGEE
jgi:hypothetical protein